MVDYVPNNYRIRKETEIKISYLEDEMREVRDLLNRGRISQEDYDREMDSIQREIMSHTVALEQL